MAYNIKGDIDASGVFSVDGKYVANHSGDNVPDSTGDLKISPGEVSFDGNINDIIIFDGTQYKTRPIKTSARVVNSAEELADEKAFSTIGKIYDITTTSTWEFTTDWVSTVGITDLVLGLMYINDRTTKLFYVEPDLNKVEFIGTQTIGNRYSQVPDMKYFNSVLQDTGVQQLPSGLKLQWGKATTFNGVGALTFSVPFDTILLGATVIDIAGANRESNAVITGVPVMSTSTLQRLDIHTQLLTFTTQLNVQNSTGIVDVMVYAWGF